MRARAPAGADARPPGAAAWRRAAVAGVAAAVVVLLIAAPPAAAYFEWHRVGTRAFALGDNFVSIADDASAVLWNPAGVVRVPQHQALLTLERSPDLEGLQHLFAAGVVHTRWLSFGAGWSATRLEDTLREDLLSLSVSHNLVRRALGAFVSVGATLKLGRIGVDATDAVELADLATSETHWTADVGLLLAPIPNVRLGVAVRNLGQPHFDLVPGGEVTRQDSEVEWGLSLRLHPQAELHFTRATLDGRSTESKVGFALGVGSALDLCFGATRHAVSAGLGIGWRRFQLEPSFRLHDEIGFVSRIGLRIDLGAARGEVGEGLGAY